MQLYCVQLRVYSVVCVCIYTVACMFVCTQLCMCSLFMYTGVLYVCMWNQSRIFFLRNLAS